MHACLGCSRTCVYTLLYPVCAQIGCMYVCPPSPPPTHALQPHDNDRWRRWWPSPRAWPRTSACRCEHTRHAICIQVEPHTHTYTYTYTHTHIYTHACTVTGGAGGGVREGPLPAGPQGDGARVQRPGADGAGTTSIKCLPGLSCLVLYGSVCEWDAVLGYGESGGWCAAPTAGSRWSRYDPVRLCVSLVYERVVEELLCPVHVCLRMRELWMPFSSHNKRHDPLSHLPSHLPQTRCRAGCGRSCASTSTSPPPSPRFGWMCCS